MKFKLSPRRRARGFSKKIKIIEMKNSNIDSPKIYDKYIVAFSGGKDSIACFLHLLDLGIDKNKIELWHCDIDGQGATFMDWEVTHSYCQRFSNHFGVPIYYAWKDGGFEREMTRENAKTAPTSFQCPDGTIKTIGGTRGKESTRRKFPQISGDLSVRWCSAYLKIDVCAAAIRNQDRFNGIKTVIISGERAEESLGPVKFKEYIQAKENGEDFKAFGRANYEILEVDRADNRNGKKPRFVDRWRSVKDWSEVEVWDIIKRYGVVVHPCYYLGWSRCSCKFCIFGDKDQFASGYQISPKQGEKLVDYEIDFGVTLKRDKSLVDLITSGTPYASITGELATIATSYQYDGKIQTDVWELPAGAYGEGCGPI